MAIAATEVAKIPGETNPVRYNGIGMPNSEKGHANARLIAAAPELLEALRGILKRLDHPLNAAQHVEYFKRWPEVESARAALKKATGT
jgi:hypothetical protein